MRELRVVAALMRASLAMAMQYRADFVVGLATGLGGTLVAIVPLIVVYQHTDSVLGWSLTDTLLVMGLFLLMNGLLGTFVEPNLGAAVEGIRSGSLDHVLLKPADAQLLVSLSRVQVDHVWDVLAAFGLVVWCAADQPALTALDVLVAAALFTSGMVAMYGLWLLAICASFWFVRVDNLRYLLWSAAGAGRWPVGVYGGWLRRVLTYAFPVGLTCTFPAVALRGEWTLPLLGIGLGVGLAFAVGSRWVWLRSISAYTSASS